MGDKLTKALDLINNKYGKGSVLEGDSVIDVPRMGTGSLGLDIITGGGYGKGRFIEIYGPESSGKTTLCIHAMVEAQRDNPDKKVAFIDTEHAWDMSYAKKLGLNVDKLIISQPDNGEQALEIVEHLVSSEEISLCVVDSIAALTPKGEIEGEMGDSKMGLHARLMSQACRKLTSVCSKTQTVIIWTNQLRDKIGVMFGSPEVTTGGNAMKFYASIRIDLRRRQGDKDADGMVINNTVTAKTVKNKLAAPFQKTEFTINFGEGISRESEIVKIGVDIGLIKKAGSWYSYEETKLGQGENNVVNLLRDNVELSEELENKIREYFNL